MIARFALLSGTALLALAAAPAFAQAPLPAPTADPEAAPSPPPAGPRPAPELPATEPPAGAETGDIVITARRRNESLQDVPLAVSVIGDERLASTASFNVSRLSQIQPSLQFYSTNPRNSAANIRGLGAPFGLTNDGIEQGVGVYVDQVYYSRIASTTFDFLDVERVEVLRGPQGTLYGKNTTAGAVNLISRPPSFEPEGRAELSLGNLGYFQARGSLSGPLIADTLAIRVAASATRRRGTIFDTNIGSWVNALENTGLRGALLWRATP
jgi:iron complex outermembrane recepter protein